MTKGWRTSWRWSLSESFHWFSSPQTWRRDPARHVQAAGALWTESAHRDCWHTLPPPLVAAWNQAKLIRGETISLQWARLFLFKWMHLVIYKVVHSLMELFSTMFCVSAFSLSHTLLSSGDVWGLLKVLLFCQCPVILDLFLPYPLVLLPPALWAQALPGCVAIVTASFFAQQVWLVHVYPPSLRPLTHNAGRHGMKNSSSDLLVCLYALLVRPISPLLPAYAAQIIKQFTHTVKAGITCQSSSATLIKLCNKNGTL